MEIAKPEHSEQSVLVRATVLNGFSALLSSVNNHTKTDAITLLKSVGIDPERIEDIEYFFPYSRFAELLKITARECVIPDIGLRFAFGQNSKILGPIAYLVLHSENIAQGIQDVARYLYHLSPAIRLYIHAHPAHPEVGIDLINVGIPEPPFAVEHNIAATFNIMREFAQGELAATRVRFRHDQIAPTEVYRNLFKCPVEFNAERNSIEIQPQVLALKIQSADSGLHALVNDYFSMLEDSRSLPTGELSWSDKTYHLIEKLMHSGRISRQDVARRLGLHERTLQRRLKEEGTSFEALLEKARRDHVAKLLKPDGPPLSQIAGLLGYCEQSSFIRAFKRWYGVTPSQYLKDH